MVSSPCESPERAHDPRGVHDGPKMARNVGSVDRWDGNERNAGPEASSQNEELGLELVSITARPDLGDEMRSDRAETALRVGDIPTDTVRHGGCRQTVR